MQITPRELLDLGKWDEYCELTGVNVWAINTGLVGIEELLPITLEQARKLLS